MNFRADLYACKRGMNFTFAGWTHPKVKWDQFELMGDRFDPAKHDATSCQICLVAKWSPVGKPKTSPNAKPKVVPKGKVPPAPTKKEPEKKICIKCKQVTGPGIALPCTVNSAKRNLADLIGQDSVPGAGARRESEDSSD